MLREAVAMEAEGYKLFLASDNTSGYKGDYDNAERHVYCELLQRLPCSGL